MDIRYKLFPYPVLSPFSDDYINSGFIAEIIPVRDMKDIVIKMNVLLDNKELEQMIKEDKAEYVFHIECSQTSYREILKSCSEENIKRIPERKLNGRVTICTFIVAKENLYNYSNSCFNNDYENMSFNIEKGSILAIANQLNIDITKETEELEKIPSIFSVVRRNVDDDLGMQIEMNSDKIKLLLCNQEFYYYRNIASIDAYQPLLHAALVLPALIYVFETLKYCGAEEYEQYEQYRWFKAIEKQLKKYNIEFNREFLENNYSYEIAQKLLGLPIGRGLSAINNIESRDDDE